MYRIFNPERCVGVDKFCIIKDQLVEPLQDVILIYTFYYSKLYLFDLIYFKKIFDPNFFTMEYIMYL